MPGVVDWMHSTMLSMCGQVQDGAISTVQSCRTLAAQEESGCYVSTAVGWSTQMTETMLAVQNGSTSVKCVVPQKAIPTCIAIFCCWVRRGLSVGTFVGEGDCIQTHIWVWEERDLCLMWVPCVLVVLEGPVGERSRLETTSAGSGCGLMKPHPLNAYSQGGKNQN